MLKFIPFEGGIFCNVNNIFLSCCWFQCDCRVFILLRIHWLQVRHLGQIQKIRRRGGLWIIGNRTAPEWLVHPWPPTNSLHPTQLQQNGLSAWTKSHQPIILANRIALGRSWRLRGVTLEGIACNTASRSKKCTHYIQLCFLAFFSSSAPSVSLGFTGRGHPTGWDAEAFSALGAQPHEWTWWCWGGLGGTGADPGLACEGEGWGGPSALPPRGLPPHRGVIMIRAWAFRDPTRDPIISILRSSSTAIVILFQCWEFHQDAIRGAVITREIIPAVQIPIQPKTQTPEHIFSQGIKSSLVGLGWILIYGLDHIKTLCLELVLLVFILV